MRVLVLTRLFPNAAEPHAASFNRQQFGALARLCDVRLLAVIPWFPGARLFARWSAAGRLVRVPEREDLHGLAVEHPRVLYLPRLGRALGPLLYAVSLLGPSGRQGGRAQVVLASWAYPDGVAGVWLAGRLGLPAVVKVHGSDLNVLARPLVARAQLAWALPRAARVVAVSRPLAERARALGVAEERVILVPNGVDRALFHLRERGAARAALGLPGGGAWIVYVGRLERAKGVIELLEAFERVAGRNPAARLVMVGDGAEIARCQAAAARWPGRLVVAGARPLAQVALFMSAADVVVLPSWNEGTPNVVLEALASGRRVVATRVGGIPDVVTSPTLGILVPPRDVAELAEALVAALREPYDPTVVAAGGPGDWEASAARLHAVLAEAVATRRPGT